MKRVLKYNLHSGQTIIWMLYGSDILTAQLEDGQLCLWAISKNAYAGREVKRVFFVVGTNEDLPEGNLNYVSTIQVIDTLHVFEIVPDEYEEKFV